MLYCRHGWLVGFWWRFVEYAECCLFRFILVPRALQLENSSILARACERRHGLERYMRHEAAAIPIDGCYDALLTVFHQRLLLGEVLRDMTELPEDIRREIGQVRCSAMTDLRADLLIMFTAQ